MNGRCAKRLKRNLMGKGSMDSAEKPLIFKDFPVRREALSLASSWEHPGHARPRGRFWTGVGLVTTDSRFLQASEPTELQARAFELLGLDPDRDVCTSVTA